MRILITGANGQLGRELTNQLRDKGTEFVLADRAKLDITNCFSVYKLVSESRPDVIINCAVNRI